MSTSLHPSGLRHERWKFEKGLHELARGCYAWLAPDGSWGWSNAGLVQDGEATLLVDTLFDLELTAEMLAAMRRAVPAAREIGALVNTHANGDHCYGNSLVAGARIIASQACAEEMREVPPEVLAAMVANAPPGPIGDFVRRAFGAFHFDGIELRLPTETFRGELEVRVGDKRVRLIEVGPAHTRGDVLVFSPSDRAIFTGDILFIGGTPLAWHGPIANWIRACDLIESLDADVVVPGHGPITDRRGARAVREYWCYVRDAARERYDAGLSAADAARDIELGPFADWGDSERIAVNVATLYREFGAAPDSGNPGDTMALMAELAARGRR
jgi:glyoxylase-like metal-dependent hydrolase (beta-lactamase superfamily II)